MDDSLKLVLHVKKDRESSYHLFIHQIKAQELYPIALHLFGINLF